MNKGNVFLNSLNDITRNTYSGTNTKQTKKETVNRFDSNILLNSKELFDDNNAKINSLQDEILSLKRKLNIIPEKDEEIQKYKCEIEKLKDEIMINSSIKSELNKLKSENKFLRDDNNKFQIEIMNIEKLKHENEMLKNKIIKLNSELKKKEIKDNFSETDIEDIMTEEYEGNLLIEEDKVKKEEIEIDIINLKKILSVRLKKYHDNHIDKLIESYDLKQKSKIEKEIMEKLLLEAIHI